MKLIFRIKLNVLIYSTKKSINIIIIFFLSINKLNFNYKDKPIISLNMNLQITSWTCSLLTFSARISYSVMFTFNTFLQITCMSCRIFTLWARIPYSFMFILNMNLRSTCLSSDILALRTRISHFFCVYFQHEPSEHLLE